MTKSSDFFRSISNLHVPQGQAIKNTSRLHCVEIKTSKNKGRIFCCCVLQHFIKRKQTGATFRLDEQFVNQSNTCRNVQGQPILKRSLRYNLLNLHESLVVTTAQSWSDITYLPAAVDHVKVRSCVETNQCHTDPFATKISGKKARCCGFLCFVSSMLVHSNIPHPNISSIKYNNKLSPSPKFLAILFQFLMSIYQPFKNVISTLSSG